MTDIQQARDVLAKWRSEADSPLPWAIENDGQDNIAVDAGRDDLVRLSSREVASWAGLADGDARLIVGTAGNSELLDAIDALLGDAARYHEHDSAHLFAMHGRLIAAAIVAVDERMTS
jgi:hypothetical protein